MPDQLPVISPTNVASLKQITRQGKGALETLVWLPDGKTLAVGGSIGVSLYDAGTLEELHFMDAKMWVEDLEIGPDGRSLVLLDKGHSTWSDKLRLWNVESGQLVRELDQRVSGIYLLALSNDGGTLAMVNGGATIDLWDVGSGQHVRTFESEHTVTNLAFSPDGHMLAMGLWYDDSNQASAQNVQLWDIDVGQPVRRFESEGGVLSLAFSPDGQLLAVGSPKAIRVWKLATGQPARTLQAQETYLSTGLAFSPDGRLLVSGGGNNTVLLWNVSEGQLVRRLWGHTGTIIDVAFTPDGRTLVSHSQDGTVRLWGVVWP